MAYFEFHRGADDVGSSALKNKSTNSTSPTFAHLRPAKYIFSCRLPSAKLIDFILAIADASQLNEC